MRGVLSGRNTLAMIAMVLLATVTATACTSRDSGSNKATPSPDSRRVVDAPIEAIGILVRESAPPGYTARITSGLPSGCAKFHEAKVTGRSGNTISVSVTNTMPDDSLTACTAIYGYHETNLDLGQAFTSGQMYTVLVNAKSRTFTAQ